MYVKKICLVPGGALEGHLQGAWGHLGLSGDDLQMPLQVKKKYSDWGPGKIGRYQNNFNSLLKVPGESLMPSWHIKIGWWLSWSLLDAPGPHLEQMWLGSKKVISVRLSIHGFGSLAFNSLTCLRYWNIKKRVIMCACAEFWSLYHNYLWRCSKNMFL